MSNVTITGMSIPNTQTPLGPDKTGVCGIENGSTTVTFATALSKVYRGKGGFLIKLHTTIHYVSHVAADGLSLTTTTSYLGSTNASATYIIYPCLELRFYCDTPFQPVGASYVIQASPIDSPNFFKSVLVSQYDAGTGDLLWLPEIILPATGDIASPPQQKAKYFPVFYTLQGGRVAFLGGFEKGLRIPESPSSTNWPDLLVAQQTQPYSFLNEASTLTTDQVLALINSAAAIDGTHRTLLMAASGGVAAEDSSLLQDVSGNLSTANSITVGDALEVVNDATIGGAVEAASAAITGAIAAGSAAVTGAVTAASATLTGALAANSATVTTGVTAASATLSGALSSGSATVSGAVSAGSAAVTNELTVGTTATVTGETDLVGGFKTRTAAQVAALTAGNYGRLTWQTDALKGWKKDYGASVGIKHALPYYDAYEQGFIPTASDSTTRTANSATWTAFISALPATGGILRFPEGTFYFSTELSTTKPVQIVGAGASFVSGGTMIGTTVVVESGENGFEFLSGASGSSVCHLNIKTRSGYSGVSTGDGIYSAVEVHIDNVSIESMGRDGIYFHGDSANTDFSSVTNVKVWGVKRDGIHYNGGGDTNVIYTANVNCTLNGRYGFYNAGSSNIFLSCHVSFSAQVTGTGKDYYDAGSSNVYILPYAESTGSNYFYFDTGAIRSTVITGLFGAPIFDAAAAGYYGRHTILDDGHWRDILIRDTGDAVGGHDYALISRNFDESGQFLLSDSTASLRVLDYRPTGTRLILPAVEIGQTLKLTGTPQTITGAGTINLTTNSTLLVTTGANAYTLAAGAEGQHKFIRMKTDGGDATITVTNLQGGTTITMNDEGDSVYLLYQDAKWNILTNNGCTVA